MDKLQSHVGVVYQSILSSFWFLKLIGHFRSDVTGFKFLVNFVKSDWSIAIGFDPSIMCGFCLQSKCVCHFIVNSLVLSLYASRFLKAQGFTLSLSSFRVLMLL